MKAKLVFLIIAILIAVFLLYSCAYEGREIAYIVEEGHPKTFIVEQENPLAWVDDTMGRRQALNVKRFIDEDKDKIEEFEIKSRLGNVRRVIDGKLIIGFDEELDNPTLNK